MRFPVVLALGMTLAASLSTLPAQAGQDASVAPKPLYERLGGVYNIAAVVDDFIERIYVNDVVNENAVVAGARSQSRKAGLKVQVTTLVCQVTGGPCKYAGQAMKESHARFGITEKEWVAMAADFKASLDKFQVPAAEQKELFAILESTKTDIVVGTSAKR